MALPFGRASRLAMIMAALLAALSPAGLHAGTLRVAVASNFHATLDAIGAAFEADSGHRLVLVPGSTGLPAVNSLVLPKVERADYNGVFAPNSKYRALVTPAKRGKGKKTRSSDEVQYQTSAEKRASMTWAKRLKRVFNIDVETCSECGGDVRIIASIEDPVVIRTILAHLDEKGAFAANSLLPDCRASPDPPMGLLV